MHYRASLAFVFAATVAALLLTISTGCASTSSSNLAGANSSPGAKESRIQATAVTSGGAVAAESKTSANASAGASSPPNVAPNTNVSQSTKDKTAGSTALTLSVSEPEDELELDGPEVTVAGRSIPGAVVSVDDTVIIADQQGWFSVTLRVEESPYPIEIVASDQDGNQVSEIRTVFLK